MSTDIYKYKELSKEDLIKRVTQMQAVIEQMSKTQSDQELLSLPWIGNLGQWYWMVESNELVFNTKKATNLGISIKDIPEKVGFEFFTEKLHPGDFSRVMENMRKHLNSTSDSYDVEYRIRNTKGEYLWYYDRGRVSKRSEDGKALVVSGIVFDISESKEMETELIKVNKELNQLVNTDYLTGAYNRRYMLNQLEKQIKLHNEKGVDLSLIMIDIDDFKFINDNFGHLVGDLLLKQIVKTINNLIRERDILSRWGGDEFIIMLANTKQTEAIMIAKQIKKAISEINIKDVKQSTVSIGVSAYKKGDSIDEAIDHTDSLLYKAKNKNKNSIAYKE